MRINATRAEWARSRAKARKAVEARRAHYAQPGVWEAEMAELEAEKAAAEAAGDEKAARRAANGMIVLRGNKPRDEI